MYFSSFFRLAHLMSETSKSVTTFVCLSYIRSRKLCEIGAKFCHIYGKSESENMTSYFASEVPMYIVHSKILNSAKWGSS